MLNRSMDNELITNLLNQRKTICPSSVLGRTKRFQPIRLSMGLTKGATGREGKWWPEKLPNGKLLPTSVQDKRFSTLASSTRASTSTANTPQEPEIGTGRPPLASS